MRITNAKIDFSRAGFQEISTEEYDKCVQEYESENQACGANGLICWDSLVYCSNSIPKERSHVKTFRLPRIYFLPPR